MVNLPGSFFFVLISSGTYSIFLDRHSVKRKIFTKFSFCGP